jgi:hypothetical protein
MTATFVMLLLAAAPQVVIDQIDLGELPAGTSPYEVFTSGQVKAEHLTLHFTAPVLISGVRFKSCAATSSGFWLTLGPNLSGALSSTNDRHAVQQAFSIKAEAPLKVAEFTLEVASDTDGGGGGELCLEKLEVLGGDRKVLELVLQPSVVSLAEAVAACERGHALGRPWQPLRCSVSAPEFTIPGREVVVVTASHHSDGDGSFESASYLMRQGDAWAPLFRLESSNSGDGPGSGNSERLVLCRASSHGVPTFDVISLSSSWGVGEDDSRTTESVDHYVWTGDAFEMRGGNKRCPLPLVPKPPAWLARATATSVLKEAGMPEGAYAAAAAADGLAETTWAEGVKGTGVGESLTLELRAPMVLKRLRLLAGCGVNAALWRRNERVKSLLVTFSDGATETFSLDDAKPGEWRPLELARVAPTSSLTLKVLAVFPAHDQDACISEVELEAR